MKCPTVAEAWTRYAALQTEAGVPNDCTSWQQLIHGPLKPPGASSIQEERAWDSARNCMITDNTAWDILRVNLIWNIRVQKCGHELNDSPFNLEKALLYAWKTTACIGKEVWAEIFRHKRSPRRLLAMQQMFADVWTITDTFATPGGNPKWTFTPPASFLPYHLATEVPPTY